MERAEVRRSMISLDRAGSRVLGSGFGFGLICLKSSESVISVWLIEHQIEWAEQ
jgi:hypothetical protein